MLHLAAPTDAGWAARAVAHLDEILLDHAHCEKKAASTAVGLLFRYPEHAALLLPLSRLAREELAHFEEVVRHLQARGVPFSRLPPSPYAAELVKIVRTSEPHKLLDTLLCCALIEARSCERMKLLGEALWACPQEGHRQLAELYRGLLASEARHHQCYVDLALHLFPEGRVRTRLRQVALHEAEVLSRAPLLPRLHNG
jgi:tRNA-(ms[2]io[6]A)-hydroxylase